MENVEIALYFLIFITLALGVSVRGLSKELKEVRGELTKYLKNIDNNLGKSPDGKSIKDRETEAKDAQRKRKEKEDERIANDPWLK